MYSSYYTPRNKEVSINKQEIWLDTETELEAHEIILAKAFVFSNFLAIIGISYSKS